MPHMKIATKELVATAQKFAESGGIVVLGAQSGLKDINCHIVEMPLPGLFRKLAGVEVADWSMLTEKDTREARLENGEVVKAFTFVERLKPLGAEVIANWISGDSLLAGGPAITRKQVGKGWVYYIGAYLPDAGVATLVSYLAAEHGLEPVIRASADVEVIVRAAGKRKFYALLNHGAGGQPVSGLPEGKELLTGKAVKGGEYQLSGFGVAVIEAGARKT